MYKFSHISKYSRNDKEKSSSEPADQPGNAAHRATRQNPEIMARVQSILDITRNAEGPLKSADEVEGLLIQEMRRLGKTTMNQWAAQAEERVVQELKEQDPTIRSRKKKR